MAQRVGSGALTYLHGDHLGSTVLTTGVSGSKSYHAYGGSRGGSVPSVWQYTGQELDGGTGLVYMHARYYDPATGQFLSPDMLVPEPADVLSYNRYLYAYGNPLKYSDASGHCATLEDGTPDFEGDAQCWLYVDELWKSWNASPPWWEARFRMSRDEFVAQFAYHAVFDEGWMGDQLLAFWGPQYQQWQIHHDRYNPAPVMNPPQNREMWFPGEGIVQPLMDDMVTCAVEGMPGCGSLLDDTGVILLGRERCSASAQREAAASLWLATPARHLA